MYSFPFKNKLDPIKMLKNKLEYLKEDRKFYLKDIIKRILILLYVRKLIM